MLNGASDKITRTQTCRLMEKNMDRPLISLVLPVYNEAGNIDELYWRCKKVLDQYESYEVIVVNDHSQDQTLQKLLALSSQDKNVKIINFSRNFGHQIAVTAGIDYACGQCVVIMDSDLQDTPETIHAMIEKWREGFEVVYARRRVRKDTVCKKVTAFLFYRILRRLTNIDIHEDTGDFRLIDAKVASELRRIREHSRFMRGITSWVGFKQTAVLFDRERRKHGKSNYPLRNMLRLAMDALTSFSYLPMRLASFLGFVAAGLSFVGILYALVRKWFFPEEVVPGWTFTIITIFFIGGVQLIVLGIIGEYIGRIYTETQNRPLYIIKDKINFDVG